MQPTWEVLVTLAGGSALGALLIVLAGYVAKRVLDRGVEGAGERYRALLGGTAAVDTDLRGRRGAAYAELWRLTGLLPEWPRATDVTYAELRTLGERLRDWYFSGQGMVLSEEAVEAYKEVQRALTRVLDRPADADPDACIGGDEYDGLQRLCSALRDELTHDLRSRRLPPPVV